MANLSAFMQGFANAGGGNAISRALIGQKDKDPYDSLRQALQDPAFQFGIKNGIDPIIKAGYEKYGGEDILEYTGNMPERQTTVDTELNRDNIPNDIKQPSVNFNFDNQMANDLNMNDRSPQQIDLGITTPKQREQAENAYTTTTRKEPEEEYQQRAMNEFVNWFKQPQQEETLSPTDYITEDIYNSMPEHQKKGWSAVDHQGQTVFVNNPYDPEKPEEDNTIDLLKREDVYRSNNIPEGVEGNTQFNVINLGEGLSQIVENPAYEEPEETVSILDQQKMYNTARNNGLDSQDLGVMFDNVEEFEQNYQNTVEVEEETEYDPNNLISGYLKNDDNITSAEREDFEDKTGRKVGEFYQPQEETTTEEGTADEGRSYTELRQVAKEVNNGDYTINDELKQKIADAGINIKPPTDNKPSNSLKEIQDTYMGYINDEYSPEKAYQLTAEDYDNMPSQQLLERDNITKETGSNASSTGGSNPFGELDDRWRDYINQVTEGAPADDLAKEMGLSDEQALNAIRTQAYNKARNQAESYWTTTFMDSYQDSEKARKEKEKWMTKKEQEIKDNIDEVVKQIYPYSLGSYEERLTTEKENDTPNLDNIAGDFYDRFKNSSKTEGKIADNKERIIGDLVDAGNSEEQAKNIYQKMLEIEKQNESNEDNNNNSNEEDNPVFNFFKGLL